MDHSQVHPTVASQNQQGDVHTLAGFDALGYAQADIAALGKPSSISSNVRNNSDGPSWKGVLSSAGQSYMVQSSTNRTWPGCNVYTKDHQEKVSDK